MDSVKQTIEKYNLIKSGEVIGVAVSGGTDSMALLHKLVELSEEMDFEVVAVHVDHQIREESGDDAYFVMDYCKQHHIRAYKFRIDVPKIAKDKGQSLETAARDARIGVFESLIQKGIIDKIAIAHHMTDQAETVLLHLFRGSGVAGAKGMEISKKGTIIRPLLETSKEDIIKYILINQIPYVQDSTNEESDFARNYIRNIIMPLIIKKWPNVINALNSFSKACSEDDEYINKNVFMDACIFEDKVAKVPTSYFLYDSSIVTRLIFKVLNQIGINFDIERKHIELIKELALSGQNGSKLDLPHDLKVHKEYDYITFVNSYVEPMVLSIPFKCGDFEIPTVGTLSVKRVKDFSDKNAIYLDYRKVPKNAMWRFKQDGDCFEKFGGGSKKLKSYLIDKKIPLRLRATLPVLAEENEVYAIAGVEISNKVRIDNGTPTFYKINFIQTKKVR